MSCPTLTKNSSIDIFPKSSPLRVRTAVRTRKGDDLGKMSIDEFLVKVGQDIADKVIR